METRKEEKLKQLNDNKESYQEALDIMARIKKPLDEYKNKLVNKNFWEKYFPISNNNWLKSEYRITGSIYSHQKKFRLYINRKIDIELNTKETKEVKMELSQRIKDVGVWLSVTSTEISRLKDFDEQALKDDLIAIYKKHGSPKNVWYGILDDLKYI